jgi:PAS domain S-box-containing protein
LLVSGCVAPRPGCLAAAIETVQQIRDLSPGEAKSQLPVKLKGVVTFFDETLFSRFVQDSTAGIYLRESTNTPLLKPGNLVEIIGATGQGEYAPIVEPQQFRVLGQAPLPAPKPTSFEQLASGSQDSQFVEISGIVRHIAFDEASRHFEITLAAAGGRLSVFAKEIPSEGAALVDSTVRARGVCSTLFNRQRQLFAIRLMVPMPEDLIIVEPSAPAPFDIPARTISSLLQFAPNGTFGHRVKLRGTVALQQRGSLLFIQDGDFGLQVHTRQADLLNIGDIIEVLGFPDQGDYTPVLEDAVYRKVGDGPAPKPQDITLDGALSGRYDSRLVRITATLVDRARQSREQFLVLQTDNAIFQAHAEPVVDANAFNDLENKSLLSVTGVCLIEPGEWQAGEQWRAESFKLLLRSRGDIVVLERPPWWTLQKLLWAVGLLAVIVLLSLVWVAALRGKVRDQTRIIRKQMLMDAALKERYEELFENANDMVFTHNLDGKITSVNRAGEALLHRPRDQVLGTNLLNLVSENDRAAARDWLEKISNGAELQTAEWDFMDARGRRVKVEISSRLVDQNGRQKEIESIARDITERRRLERELLEISNREQRRIGHDLHDGVCQQLAGIAYRVDALGGLLEEAKRPEAAEADKIAALISEATVQARSVARGLFPVRLEENGLLAALDELADSASNRFPVECVFSCQPPAPSISDNDKALHLYYIAQEALVNAVRHGKARNAWITVSKTAERHRLVVRDNGAGFDPGQQSASGMGIRIMRYRAKVIGATLDVQSAPGQGAEIACHFVSGA